MFGEDARVEDFAVLLDEIQRILPNSELTRSSEDELAAIRHDYPNIPEHYVSFLRCVGWGSLGNGTFMIYSGPCEPSDFFDEATSKELEGILFFGDDFAGWMAGFDLRNDLRIVGIDSCSRQPDVQHARTIAEFITQVVSNHD